MSTSQFGRLVVVRAAAWPPQLILGEASEGAVEAPSDTEVGP